MTPSVAQRFDTQRIRYPKPTETEAKKTLLNGKEILKEEEEPQHQYVTHDINRENVLKDIAYLTQYMEDLKAGKPVENICGDDSWYLVPENIAMVLESQKALLDPNIKFIRVNNLKDLIGEWDI